MADEALLTADKLLDAFLRANPKGKYGGIDNLDLGKFPTGKAILQAKPDEQAAMVTSALERLHVPIPGWERVGPRPPAAESFDGHNPRGLVIVVVAFVFFDWLVPDRSKPDWVMRAKSKIVLSNAGDWLKQQLPENAESTILKKLKPPRPLDFARYSAMSAFLISTSAVVPSRGPTAMPILAPILAS